MKMENSQPLTEAQTQAWLCGAHGLPSTALPILTSGDALIFGSGLLTLLVPGHVWTPRPKVDVFVESKASSELLAALGGAFSRVENSTTPPDAFSSLILRRFESPSAVVLVTKGSPRQALALAGVGGDLFVEGGALRWSCPEALGDAALLRTPCARGFEHSEAACHARLRGLTVFRREAPSALLEGQAQRETEQGHVLPKVDRDAAEAPMHRVGNETGAQRQEVFSQQLGYLPSNLGSRKNAMLRQATAV